MKKPPTNCNLELGMIIELFESQIATEKIFTIYLDCLLRFKADLDKIGLVVMWMKEEKIIKDFKFFTEDDYYGSDEQRSDSPFHLFEIEFDSKENVLQSLRSGIAKTKLIQRVFFDRTSGTLIVDGEKLVILAPGSDPFFFVDMLEDSFNDPISHKKIYAKCTGKVESACRETTSGTFVSDQKKEIKRLTVNKSDKKLLEKILKNGKTANGRPGIRLTNP